MRKLLDFIFRTHVCVLCSLPTKRKIDLCSYCENELPWIKQACMKCGAELSQKNSSTQQLCAKCLKTPPPYSMCIALFRYDYPINQLITGIKFKHKLIYAQVLGDLLTKKMQLYYHDQPLPELIIPVPLHRKRLRERGFNQSIELAKPAAKLLKIPIDRISCCRTRHTSPQSSIPAKERYKNVKNAFEVRKKIDAKHILIIDDVITTGNTIKELTKALSKHGVTKIDVWSMAKTQQFS